MNLPNNPSNAFKLRNPHIYQAGDLSSDTEQERSGDPFSETEGARAPFYKGRCRLRVVSFRRRLLDGHWNFYSGHFIDSLTEMDVIRGDSEKDIEVEQHQVKVSHVWQERTEIEIIPLPTNPVEVKAHQV